MYYFGDGEIRQIRLIFPSSYSEKVGFLDEQVEFSSRFSLSSSSLGSKSRFFLGPGGLKRASILSAQGCQTDVGEGHFASVKCFGVVVSRSRQEGTKTFARSPCFWPPSPRAEWQPSE